MTRADRLSQLIQKEVSDVLQRRTADPRLQFCSVTHVALSRDLKFAKIYISAFGGRHTRADIEKALRSAQGFMRGELAHRLSLRTVPEITFRYDESLERGDRVLALMEKIKHENR